MKTQPSISAQCAKCKYDKKASLINFDEVRFDL